MSADAPEVSAGGQEPVPGAPGSAVPTDAARRNRRPHPVLRVLRFLFGLVIQLVLLVLLLVVLVLGTQTGLRTALAIAEDLAPGMIHVGKVEGRVLGRLHLEDVEVHVADLDLAVGSFDLDWSPLAALTGTLRIHQIAARDVDVTVAPGEKKKEPLTLSEVALPLAVEIDEALVERLKVFEPGAETPSFELDRAALAARLQGSALDLTRLEVDLPQPRLKARATGQAQLVDSYPLGLDLSWELGMEPAVRLEGKGHVRGDLERLAIDHQIAGSARVRLDAHVQDVLTHPSWDGEIRLEGVDLPDFSADAPKIELTARVATNGNLDEATAVGALQGKATDLPDFGHLEANLDARWKDQVLTLRTLDLKESVSGALLTVNGDLDIKPKPGRFVIKGSWEKLRWPLSGDIVAESPKGKLDASGTFDAYDYRLSGAAQGSDFPSVDLSLAGTGDQHRTHVETLEAKTLGGNVTATGDLAWSPDLSWDLQVRGQDLNPEELAPGVVDRIGLALDSKGGLDGFSYDLSATTEGPGLPPARLALGGKGDIKGTVIDTLRLDALEGRIEGKAKAAWDPKVTWEAELQASGINPGAYAAEWPGRIGGRVTTQGALEPDGPHLSALIDGFEGELRGYPVAVGGQVHMAGKSIRVEGFKASSGPSTAQVDGAIEGESLDLAFDLASPDLASLLPEAKGRFEAKGRVGGTLQAPQVKLDLSAKDAEMAGQGIGTLTGTADVALTPDGRFDIRLDGKNLVAGGMVFDTLTVRGDGGMSSHRLSASVTGQQLSAQLEGSGSLSPDGAYEGSLSRLDLDNDPFGTWRLQKPMPVKLAGERIAAGPLCIRNPKGSGGCLGFDQTAAGQWSADIDLDKLGFELIQGFLPEKLVAEGGARVKGRFQAAGAVLTGSAVAEVPEGRLRVVLGAGKQEELDFSSTRLTVDAGARGIGAKLGLPVRGLGEVQGNLDLPGWRLDDPARPSQPLRGGVKARVDGLARVSDLFPDVTGVKGSIDADLNLDGTLAAPRVRGQANTRGLGAEVPLIGLKVSDLNVGMIANGDRLDIQGQGDVGGGRLEMSGDFRLGPSGLVGQLRAGGQRLKVADTKEYFALVSPTFDVRVSPEGTQVRGEIAVPEARIRPRSIPAGTVSPSPDVVMIDKAKGDKAASTLDIDVKVKLGDDVTIDAFGVRGRLTGAIRAFQIPGREMLGDGQLAIEDGFYRLQGAFGLSAEIGAPLTIEQGRLIYAKSPIDNPGLLLQAQREGGDTTAGVRVRGTIRRPKLAFFSESDPDMTQAEITKYLVTGVPPKRDTGAADQSLSVGTYVAPKLYMEYESGLNDQKDKVKLRYDLNRRIELQTETGDNPGGDIFYKFEN